MARHLIEAVAEPVAPCVLADQLGEARRFLEARLRALYTRLLESEADALGLALKHGRVDLRGDSRPALLNARVRDQNPTEVVNMTATLVRLEDAARWFGTADPDLTVICAHPTTSGVAGPDAPAEPDLMMHGSGGREVWVEASDVVTWDSNDAPKGKLRSLGVRPGSAEWRDHRERYIAGSRVLGEKLAAGGVLKAWACFRMLAVEGSTRIVEVRPPAREFTTATARAGDAAQA
ncbi:hypothetical protein CKO28_00355 [Rhodovibrio sodomensis]|uniref:Uncharacterized protein n=1 Tax=Rhodovibrio sodomensis TaxID=1088 RepID=A0ABS1D941_9PROT|nr:hypothetical protein [Rhodovibrio sodomensis]MBK1666491.1 hypothetical protein [Rhodovibrio sodomensis]